MPRPGPNGWLMWVVGFIALLAIGAYGYGYTAIVDHEKRMEATYLERETRTERRLERIENKLDCALGLRGGCN